MKKCILFVVFALVCVWSGFGQEGDSLLVVKQVDSLLTAANKLRKAGKNEEALPFAQQAADISKQKWGENNVKYAASVNRLASIYGGLGQFTKAEELFLKTIDLRKNLLGKEHPDYASCLNSLGNLYFKHDDYNKAEPLYWEAKDIWEKVVGKEHPDYAVSLQNLIVLYRDKGDYAKGEPLLLELKEIRAKVSGKEDPNYASALNSLANLYKFKGDYAKAEPLFLELKEIRAKTPGKEHPDYAGALNNLANLYRDKGDRSKAEPLYLEALSIVAKTPGKESQAYAGYLHNLALLYMNKGDYDKAESMFLEVTKIFANASDKERRNQILPLTNLANLYHYKGEYAKAEPLYIESKEICAKTFGKEHPEYARSLINLANLYNDKGDYAKAEPLYLEAKEILTKSLGKEHPDYTATLEHLAIHYQNTNRISESATLFLEANDLNQRLIEKSAIYSSESQMLAYLYTFNDDLARFQSFAQTYPSAEFNRACFDNALFYNGFLLENARHLSSSVARADSLTRNTYEHWQACRRRLANEYTKPIAERRFVAEVEDEAEGYEKTLTRSLPSFSEARRGLHWQDVRDSMPPGESAVEFIQYRYHTPKATDSTMYAALVLRPGWEQPRFVPLFEEKELSQLLNCEGLDVSECISISYPKSKVSPLYSLLFQPLEPHLAGAKTIVFAPAGQLHLLNFSAIGIGGDSILSQKYRLIQVGSTRQLMNRDSLSSEKTQAAAFLFGGVQYNMDSTAILAANAKLETLPAFKSRGAPELVFSHIDSTMQARPFNYLQGTAEEVENIRPVIQNRDIAVHTFTGFEATEEAFKYIGLTAPPPRVLHLATHGFFFPNPKNTNAERGLRNNEPVFKISDHPMIRSGLVLAGGNYAWEAGKPAGPDLEDGILTAYEISQTNLRGTELVVLSACQTGLGDLHTNEGVYGLQRAFKIAGARYLVMSLWEVLDSATQEFMTLFYQKWLSENLPLPDAFRATQAAMREKYPDQPMNWAGWVLVE